MRLKQIKLSGFKSFVDSTSVPFPQQMTAVVGPNGCGKSNVIDAVRWVLGESSAKNLRGDAMTDVIFNGSAQRKPVSQASVELVFENTEGRLAGGLADRSEIAIKRIVTRDAQSSYYLNGTKCRRRDITDIFLGTGLGPRSYAIIEQGMISRLIESKPQELRVFIEEAAGISKYKERRRETENRIKHTRENLDRLADVREELGKNIEKLRRQATAAQRYKELKAQERKLKAELTTIKWLQYSNRYSALEQQLQQQQTELEKYQSQELGDQRVLLELKQQAQDGRSAFEQAQSEFYQLGASISRLEQQILHQRQSAQTLTAQREQTQQALSVLLQELTAEQALQLELEQQLASDAPQLAVLEEQLALLSEQLQQLEDAQYQQQQAFQRWQQQHFSLQQQQQQQQLQFQNQQQQQQQVLAQQQQLQHELAELAIAPLEHKLSQLQQAADKEQQQLAQASKQHAQQNGYLQQQQLLLSELEDSQRNAETALKMIQHEISRLTHAQQQQDSQQQQLLLQLDIAPQWAAAVVQALGQLQHASCDTAATEQSWVSANSRPAVAGSLAETVRAGRYPEYFNQIFCADSIEQAQQQVLGDGQSVICANGYWRGSNWALSSDSTPQDSYLLRQERLVALTQEQAVARQQLAAAQQHAQTQREQVLQLQQQQQATQQQLQQLERTVQQRDTERLLAAQALAQATKLSQKLQADNELLAIKHAQLEETAEQLLDAIENSRAALLQHESAQQQLQQQQGSQQSALQQLRSQHERTRTELQQVLMQHKVAEQQHAAATANVQRMQRQQLQLQEQLQALNAKLQTDDEPELLLQEQLQHSLLAREDAKQAMIARQELLNDIETQIRQLEQGQQGIMQLLNKKRTELAEIKLDAEGYRVRANNMLELLREQQANMKDVLASLPPEAEEAPWQSQLDKTVDAVSRLGPINLAAIEEFEQQAERKQYLDAQNDDLTAAMDTLETAIRKIDKETRQKFKETFEQVNDGLKSLFPKVFGGGSAYLDLTQDDMLETGVTIMARPPGKKNSTIHLLSGGEKALTALSLVFSIFRLNPAPFCMLDEVDAPLDDANVGRFCNLVREMSETVQFIYISHNKIAMEMAAQLMGVTMQEPGVSRVVAVDVEDAVKMAAAS